MASIVTFMLVTFLYVGDSNWRVNGRLSSTEEDILLEQQLKILNKPAIKTVQDDGGDIFDCVDINKQPAFDHPLLKNHKIQTEYTTQSTQSDTLLWKGVDCPQGTVPIRRVTKEDLVRARSFLESHTTPSLISGSPGQHVAVIRSKNTTRFYKAVGGYFNILNPRVGGQQWSSGEMWIENGPNNDLNTIQAGWAVSPKVFGDAKARSFVYWRGKGNSKGCYNFLCPGFVQVQKHFPLGSVLSSSSLDQTQVQFPLSIEQDATTKNWFLVNTMLSIRYGYWPKELFPHLEGGAPLIAWGGRTSGSANEPSPPMGSGEFPNGLFKRAGFFVELQVIDDQSPDKKSPARDSLETYVEGGHCYHVRDYGFTKESGYTFMYGGPGGNNC